VMRRRLTKEPGISVMKPWTRTAVVMLAGLLGTMACMLTRVDPVADQAAMAAQAGTAVVGGSLLAVLP
jgi:hypothetical protein